MFPNVTVHFSLSNDNTYLLIRNVINGLLGNTETSENSGYNLKLKYENFLYNLPNLKFQDIFEILNRVSLKQVLSQAA
jgi:hypothetical protein